MDESLNEKTVAISKEGDVLKSVDAVVLNITTTDELQQFYDKWAATYDEDIDRMNGGYPCPQHLVNYIEKFLSNRNARILDIACGTGKVGRLLKDKGYSNVDGHDGNETMLNVARHHKIYNNYYLEFISDEPMKTVPPGSYDAVVMTGAFTRGHLTAKCLLPIGLCLKPKGLMIIAMRATALEWPDFQDMEPKLAELQEQGFWTKIFKGVIEDYCQGESGIVHVYVKM